MAPEELPPLAPSGAAGAVRATHASRTSTQDTVWTVTATAIAASAGVAVVLAVGLGSHAQAAVDPASTGGNQGSTSQQDANVVTPDQGGQSDGGFVTGGNGRAAVGGSGGS